MQDGTKRRGIRDEVASHRDPDPLFVNRWSPRAMTDEPFDEAEFLPLFEGARRGLAVHAMAGFDYERAAEELGVPAELEFEAMVAIGERAPAETLPGELREHEDPSGRKPLDETVPPGGFE
jgi:hypothetical protein